MSTGQGKALEADGGVKKSKDNDPDPIITPANNPRESESETRSTIDPPDSSILHTSELGNFDLSSTIDRLQGIVNGQVTPLLDGNIEQLSPQTDGTPGKYAVEC